MASTFDARMQEIGAIVGAGSVEGKVVIDQIYALAIHSGYWRTGPLAGVTNRPRHGGETHFLTNPLYQNRDRYMRNLAHAALEPGGLVDAMAENMEDLTRDSSSRTPREKGALAASGHPIVTVGGVVAYDRPPLVKRLSRDELKRRHEFVPQRHFGRGR